MAYVWARRRDCARRARSVERCAGAYAEGQDVAERRGRGRRAPGLCAVRAGGSTIEILTLATGQVTRLVVDGLAALHERRGAPTADGWPRGIGGAATTRTGTCYCAAEGGDAYRVTTARRTTRAAWLQRDGAAADGRVRVPMAAHLCRRRGRLRDGARVRVPLTYDEATTLARFVDAEPRLRRFRGGDESPPQHRADGSRWRFRIGEWALRVPTCWPALCPRPGADCAGHVASPHRRAARLLATNPTCSTTSRCRVATGWRSGC